MMLLYGCRGTDRAGRTRSMRVTPCNIFSSHLGALPASVAKLTSKPAALKAAYGTAVSEGEAGDCQLITRMRCPVPADRLTCGIVAVVGHQKYDFDHGEWWRAVGNG
jgi:hypothetical protein